MDAFNSGILNDTKHISPIIVNDLKKTNPQLEKIRNKMTPSRVMTEGYFKNLMANNMTQSGINSVNGNLMSKITNGVIPIMSDEVNEIVKIFQTSGLINRNESVPGDYYNIRFLGGDNAVPNYVGVSAYVPYELNLKELMRMEGFTEDDVKKHFNDIKGYWNLLSNGGAATGMVDLLNKVNNDEDEFYGKVKDFFTTVAGKTLTYLYSVKALMCTSKGCKNIGYCPDPWISIFLSGDVMRLKGNEPNWSVRFNLTSWETAEAFNKCTAKYFMEVSLFYKVNKKLFGCTFERNGTTY